MEHHHFTQGGINTLLKLQNKTTDSIFTRDPMAEVSHLPNPRIRLEMPLWDWDGKSVQWMKTENRLSTNSGLKLTRLFCSSLVQLTWLPNNCKREHQRGRLAGILQDCNSFGFGKVRSPGTRKIQRQIKSNCERPKQLFSSGTLNRKLENGYFLWRTGISRMEPYSPS